MNNKLGITPYYTTLAFPGINFLRHDVFTDQIFLDINASGEVFFSGTSWQRRHTLRVSVVNWRTNEEDIRRAIAATEAVLKGCCN